MNLWETIILSPSVTFRQVSQELADVGWQRDPDLTNVDPQEPEFASWSQGYDDELDYFFNSSTGLRIVNIRGEHAIYYANKIARNMQTLTLDAIQILLYSDQTENVLQGIAATKVMKAMPLMEPLARLCNHPNPKISESAIQAFKQCFPDMFQMGASALRQAKAKHPERSVLFPHLGDVSQRRQILRWLIHDYSEANDDILATLRSALIDSDWEVRVTAILAAARFKALPLRNLIRKVELPGTSREGLNVTDRQLISAFRKASIAWLEGQTPPPDTNHPSSSREDMRWHVLRCVAGLPVNWRDRVFLLAYSLTEPLPPCETLPANLPSGVIEEQGRFHLAQTAIELVWVPPILHWLGDDLEQPCLPNQIRAVKPESGFFISKYAIAKQLLQALKLSHNNEELTTAHSQYHTCSWTDAQQICEALSQIEKLSLTLPTADEWEMAARGPDGRRFPWGNGLERDMLRSPSPWGCHDMVGILSQWTNTPSESGEIIVCGGTNQLRCAMRETTAIPQGNVGFRVVFKP